MKHLSLTSTLIALLAVASGAGTAQDILSATGGVHAKIVWTVGGNRIEGFDTRTGSKTTILAGLSKAKRPFVTRDGAYVVYCTGGKVDGIQDFGSQCKIYVVGWDGSGNKQISSNGYLTSLWTDGSGKEWAIAMKSSRSSFFKVPVHGGNEVTVTNKLSGGRADLQLSADGKRACHAAGSGNTGWIDLTNGTVSNKGGGCRSSMAPDNSYRWSHLNGNHNGIQTYVGNTGKSGIGMGSQGYYPRWTNKARFFTWGVNAGGFLPPCKAVQLKKFNSGFTGIEKSITVVTGSNIFHPSARIGFSGSTPPPPPDPELSLSASSLSFTAEAGGANPSSKTVNASNSGGGTLPTLSAAESASWLTVEVQGSGDNQKLVNSVDIAELEAKKYTTTVTVKGNGIAQKSYTVELTVASVPVYTSLAVAPLSATVVPGGTKQFAATAEDQYGEPLAKQPTVSWSATGAGTISSSGLFQARDTEGTATITAEADGKQAQATVTVATAPSLHLKVNIGGDAVSGWESQSGYVTAGSVFSTSASIDLSKADQPAPEAVYQSCRHEDPSIVVSSIPNGTYQVRLHFAEPGNPSIGTRQMDIVIEGTTVLSDLDPFAEVGKATALIKEFTVDVSDNNGLSVDVRKGTGNDSYVCGLEILGDIPSTRSAGAVRQHSRHQGITLGRSSTGLTVSAASDELRDVRLLDLDGAVIARAAQHHHTWVVPKPPAGTYVVEVRTDKRVLSRRVSFR